MNSSGIRPVEYNVLVLPDVAEETTSGGVFLPDDVKEKNQFARMDGVIVAASPMAFTFDDWPENRLSRKPQIGDRVMFSRYAGDEIDGADGQKYRIMKDRSVMAVVEQKNDGR